MEVVHGLLECNIISDLRWLKLGCLNSVRALLTVNLNLHTHHTVYHTCTVLVTYNWKKTIEGDLWHDKVLADLWLCRCLVIFISN